MDELKLVITADNKTASGLTGASNNLKIFKDSFINTAKTVGRWAKYIGVSLLGLGVYAVKTAYAFEDLRDKLGQAFGSSAKEAERFSREFAKNSTRDINVIASIVSEFGLLFKNMGLGGQKALELTKQFTAMSAALADTFGGENNAADAIKQALAPMARLKALSSKGLINIQEEKQLKAINNIEARAKLLFSILERKNKDWKQQIAEDNPFIKIQNSFKNFVANIGEAIKKNAKLNDVFNKISQNLDKLGEGKWLDNLGAQLNKLLNAFADMLDPSKSLSEKMGRLITAMAGLAVDFALAFIKALLREWPTTALVMAGIFATQVAKALIAAKIASFVAGGTTGAAATGGATAMFAGLGNILKTGFTLLFTTVAGKLILALTSGYFLGKLLDKAFGVSDKVGSAVGNAITPLEGGGKRSAETTALREARYQKLRRNSLPTGNDTWDAMMNKKEGVTKTPGEYTPLTELPTEALSPFRRINDEALLKQVNDDLEQKQLVVQQQTRDILANFTGIKPHTASTGSKGS